MAVKAFTNQVGSFYHGDYRQDLTWGYTGSYRFSNPSSFWVYDSYSGKSNIVHGDHRGPTPAWREVRSIIRDEPYVKRDVSYYDGELYSEIFSKRFLSGTVPTMFLSPPPRLVEEMEACRNAAITKARNQLRGESTSQNGADLGEARQTANMLASSLKDLVLGYRSARKGRWREAAGHLGILDKRGKPLGSALAQKRLEVVYGWRPLVSSMYDTAAALSAIANRASNVIQVRRSGGQFTFSESTTTPEGFRDTWSVVGNAYCGLDARVIAPSIVNADTLGLMNPLSTGWELVPFSFVFDWFIPIGDMLSALSATAGLEFSSGFISSRYEATFTRHAQGDLYTRPGVLMVKNFRFDRDLVHGFPLGGLYGKKNPFSTQHILNALALLRMSN